jgi:hypothetical protein
MSLPRIVLSVAVAIAALLACLAPRASAPAPTIPARELLTLAQQINDANYTFDRATSEALASVTVPRPAEDASLANLESSLREAGFQLRPVGPEGKRIFLVERARS